MMKHKIQIWGLPLETSFYKQIQAAYAQFQQFPARFSRTSRETLSIAFYKFVKRDEAAAHRGLKKLNFK